MVTATATRRPSASVNANAWRAYQTAGVSTRRAVPRPHRLDTEDLSATALLTEDIGAYPVLDKAEERAVALRARAGDTAARELLIVSNLRLVCALAGRYVMGAGGLAYEDLVSEGFFGLMRAVDRYDPDGGASLSTYATLWIRQAMGRALDTQGRAIRYPEHVATARRTCLRARKRLYAETGREPSHAEIAAATGLSVASVARLLAAPAVGDSLDRLLDWQHDGIEERTLGDTIADGDPTPDEQVCEMSASDELLATLRRHLSAREYAVVTMRYGLAGEREHTLADAGKRLKVSRERARQLEASALAKLRLALGAGDLQRLMAS